MPHIPSSLPYTQQSVLHERSPMAPKRDHGSPSQIWKQHNQVAGQIESINEAIKGLHRAMSQTKLPVYEGLHFHPFKIYHYPDMFRSSSYVGSGSSDTWRKVRVRSGNVLTSYVSTSSIQVKGTDGVKWPDNQYYPPEASGSTELDITVPLSSSAYWLWIEQSGSTGTFPQYFLRHGPTPATTTTFNPNPWSTFPSVDGTHTMIGYVDTSTSGSKNQLFVRQYLRTDVMSQGQGGTVKVQLCDPNTGVPVCYDLVGSPCSGSTTGSYT